jgi:hypothetical protein
MGATLGFLPHDSRVTDAIYCRQKLSHKNQGYGNDAISDSKGGNEMTAETTKTSEVTGYSATPGHPSIRWTAWFRWLLATFLGLLGGFAVFLMIGTTAGEFIDAVFPSFVFGLILGAIFGTAFGIAHWLFLRRYLEGIGIWIPTTALAFTLAAAAIFGLFGDENPEQVTFLMRLSHGILVGMSLGVAQWLVLRSKLGG